MDVTTACRRAAASEALPLPAATSSTAWSARTSAVSANVSLYYTERGNRKTLKYVDAPVAPGSWHTFRVEFAGQRIAVSLDGKRAIEFEDKHLTGTGAVGVWTKADSVTAFDDFTYGETRR